MAKWWGTDKIDLRENEEYGECSLIKAMQKVLDKFDIENVTLARKVGIGPREERKLVDNKALREAIVNAFAHNDYTVGDTPVFEIFSNRFEFTTYGGLVEGLTQEEFFSGVSRPRNPEIMRIFKDLEYVERLGSGIPYIVNKYGKEIFKLMSSVIRYAYVFEEVVKVKETTPKTAEKETTPKITTPITTPKTTPKTTSKWTSLILQKIQDNPSITMNDLSKVLNITTIGARWHIRNLQKNGTIHRVGTNRKGYWKIVHNDVQSRPDHAPISPRSRPDHAPIMPQSRPDHAPITPRSRPDHASKVILAIQDNPSATMEKLAEILGMTMYSVRWNMRNLQKRGIIRRIGSNRKGYWEII